MQTLGSRASGSSRSHIPSFLFEVYNIKRQSSKQHEALHDIFRAVDSLAIGASTSPVSNSVTNHPVAINAAYELNTRDPLPAKKPAGKAPTPAIPEHTERFEVFAAAAARAGKQLVPNNWYVFTLGWDLPAAVEGTLESKTELQQLQQRLRFEHVAVVAGQVVEKKRGPPGEQTVVGLDFESSFMDLIKKKDGASELRGLKRLDLSKPLDPGQTLVWAKQTTSKKGEVSNINKIGKAYFSQATHKRYDVVSDRATFRDAKLLEF